MHQQVRVAVMHVQIPDHLSMAAVQTLRQSQDSSQVFHGFSQGSAKRGEFRVKFFGGRQPVIARDQGNHIQLFWFESTQAAVTDEVFRM